MEQTIEIPTTLTGQPLQPTREQAVLTNDCAVVLSFFNYLPPDSHPKRGYCAKACGMNERKFRAVVAELNGLGYPVVSKGNGFFLSRRREDTEAAVRILRASALSMLTRAAALNKTSPKHEAEQLALTL
jgi:hypothetical protein